MLVGLEAGLSAIEGAIERAMELPSLTSQSASTQNGSPWTNNWADWDNSGGHNDWDDFNPKPPGQ